MARRKRWLPSIPVAYKPSEEIIPTIRPVITKRVGAGWVAEEALAIAIYCALVANGDFKKGVLLAVNQEATIKAVALSLAVALTLVSFFKKVCTILSEKCDLIRGPSFGAAIPLRLCCFVMPPRTAESCRSFP
jgi:hypothetical protein